MRIRPIALLVGATVAVTVASGCATAAPRPLSDPIALLIKDRCTRCHTVDRIKEADYDAVGWRATVVRMRDLKGAQVSEAEVQQIVDFLVGGGSSKL
jgi:hypothetical protein